MASTESLGTIPRTRQHPPRLVHAATPSAGPPHLDEHSYHRWVSTPTHTPGTPEERACQRPHHACPVAHGPDTAQKRHAAAPAPSSLYEEGTNQGISNIDAPSNENTSTRTGGSREPRYSAIRAHVYDLPVISPCTRTTPLRTLEPYDAWPLQQLMLLYFTKQKITNDLLFRSRHATPSYYATRAQTR